MNDGPYLSRNFLPCLLYSIKILLKFVRLPAGKLEREAVSPDGYDLRTFKRRESFLKGWQRICVLPDIDDSIIKSGDSAINKNVSKWEILVRFVFEHESYDFFYHKSVIFLPTARYSGKTTRSKPNTLRIVHKTVIIPR